MKVKINYHEKYLVYLFFLQLAFVSQAQNVKACDKWLTDFIEVAPRMSDGSSISKYVEEKLQTDLTISGNATCEVGLKIYVNCNGEFSYEKMKYSNNNLLVDRCNSLLQSTEKVINGIKTFLPGTIDNEKKDFIFKLVVRINHNGKVMAEILY